MSKLYLSVAIDERTHNLTRAAERSIDASFETQLAKVKTVLRVDGTTTLRLYDKEDRFVTTLWIGDVDEIMRDRLARGVLAGVRELDAVEGRIPRLTPEQLREADLPIERWRDVDTQISGDAGDAALEQFNKEDR